MSGQNPDPLEDHLTGLEPGGGVPPGETPPGEASTGGPQGHGEGGPSRGSQVAVLVALGIVVALCLLFFIGYIVGLL